MRERLYASRPPRGLRSTALLCVTGVVAAVSLVLTPTRAHANAVTEIQVPSFDAAPVGIATGPGGTLWFVENTGYSVGRIDSSGNVTEFPVPLNSTGQEGSLNSITEGPDGAMWFTDESAAVPRIGRIAPSSGAVTMYELGSRFTGAGAQPLGITSGPDGALWFTGFNGSLIGRIDTSGHATSYALKSGGQTRGLTAGPDGGIWFTVDGPDAVGRLDPASGAITLHKLRSAGQTVVPAGITTGPDGALWFTESGANRIGRINPSTGRIATFPIPTAGAVPLGISTGPDGGVWFAEAGAGNIGRIDPKKHKVAEYPLSSGFNGPMQIAAGSDGGLWITETGSDKIARLDPTSPPSGAPNASTTTTGTASARFEDQCPAGLVCVSQVSTGGTFKVKNFVQPLPAGAIRLTGYIMPPANPDGSFTLHPPLIGQELVSQPVPVPGGLLGTFPLLGPIVGPLVGHANDLSISLSLAGPVDLTINPVGAVVPLTLHLNNQLLGSNCIITPVTQHLLLAGTAAGAADPAMSWKPQPVDGTDKTFAVPGATGCGAVPPVFDLVINNQLGLPSASGNNAANIPAILSEGVGLHP